MCDVLSHDNSSPLDVSKDQFEDFSESNEEFSSTDDDSFSFDKIDYVEASPPDSELVSSEVMEIVIPEVGGIKASNDNPIPFYNPIISGTPLNLTPSKESDFFLEVDAFLAVEDEFTSFQFAKSYLDPEGDMLLFEAFLNDDLSSNFQTKSSSTSLNSLLEETNNFNNSLPEFTTFLNVLCDAEYESDSSDDQSCSDEDVLETIVLKPLSEEEIIPMKSLRTHDSSLLISSKIDYFLDEFAGELTLLKSIPPRIDETDCDFEEDIRLIEKLLYDNSFPRPLKEFVSANSDATSESFSPSPILVKDSDSLMEEIDLFCTPDYPMPPGIVDEDYDSERDILIPKDLPRNNTLSFAKKESFHFDIPPFSRPLTKPPDSDTGILNIKMMGDIYDQKAFIHKLMITLASHQEKYPDLLSHRCGTVKKFNTHRNVEDKILVPKLPENYARCGHLVNGPYCQGCALLRDKLEEDLVTYLKYFQDTSESSDESTNVVNPPREPVVVKQAHGVTPPHIDKCCCECGNVLDGIFCQHCICKSCGKGAHTGYNCPPKAPIISSPKPCNQTMNNELPQTLPSFDSTCYSDKENSVPCVSKPNFVDESSNIFNPPPQHPIYYCEIYGSNTQYGHYCTPQAPFINPKPGYSQDFNFPQNIHDFQQQYLCCDQCGARTRLFNSLHNEDVSDKIFSNPLFEEEIISIRIDQHHFNAESDLVESMLNRDSSVIASSSKIDSLLDEFV
nr:hypothetical protein [Tanacetum cinerariifolium]